jgi:hypothetical protein
VALKVMGDATSKRERWLSIVVCLVIEAGGEEKGMDYFYKGRLVDEGNQSCYR